MTKSEEQYYLDEFFGRYGVEPNLTLKIMRECEKMLDPDDFDYDYWENLCREELTKEMNKLTYEEEKMWAHLFNQEFHIHRSTILKIMRQEKDKLDDFDLEVWHNNVSEELEKFKTLNTITSEKFLELLSFEIDSIEYKGKDLSIDKDVSSPEKIKFIWGKKQKTIYPNWDNPKEDAVIKKAVEDWIKNL